MSRAAARRAGGRGCCGPAPSRWRSLPADVLAEVLLGDAGQRAVGAQRLQGLVDPGLQVGAVLAEDQSLLARRVDLGSDLHVLVAGGLLVLEEGQAVVDRDVDTPLLEQGDGLGEALDGLDLR